MTEKNQKTENAEKSFLGIFSYFGATEANGILQDIANRDSNFLRGLSANKTSPVVKEHCSKFKEFQDRFISKNPTLSLPDSAIGLAFRGQAAHWPLNSKLKRFWKKFDRVYAGREPPWPDRSERDYLISAVNEKVVKKYLWQDAKVLHPTEDHLLAILQHYGAPTSLLDWTLDVNTALYFAYADAPAEGRDRVTIYIVDIGKMHVMNYRACNESNAVSDQTDTTSAILSKTKNYTQLRNTWTFLWPKVFGDIRFAVQQCVFSQQRFDTIDEMLAMEDFLKSPPTSSPDARPIHTPIPGTLWVISLPVSDRPEVMEYLEQKEVIRERLFVTWDDICSDLVSRYTDQLLDKNPLGKYVISTQNQDVQRLREQSRAQPKEGKRCPTTAQ